MTSIDLRGLSGRNWRRLGLLVVALGGALALVIALLTRDPPPERSEPLEGRLELAAGEVRITAGGSSVGTAAGTEQNGKARTVGSGTALAAGSEIVTGKGARALVRMPDGSTIFLRGGSNVRLARDALELAKGEYWLDAPPTDRKPLTHRAGEVEVSAADAGLSLRRTGEGGERVIVYAARGMALVSAKAGRVEVRAGEQAIVETGKAPRVEPIAFWDDWTGGMADSGPGARAIGSAAGSIYGVDSGGSFRDPPRRLEIAQQAVRAVVREGLAETEVDQTFFNPGERAVEGWYWFTVPTRAMVTGFAVETNGVMVEGEFIERREAAQQYVEAKSSGASPAILEYIDAGTFRARIFPIAAGGTRRVMLRYLELRPTAGEKLEYVYPMGTGEPVRIGEFSLSVDLGDAGKQMDIATLADARVEQGGKLVTMRRSGYTPRAPFQLEAKLARKREPLTVARFNPGDGSADYVLARFHPDVDWATVKQQRADVVVVVDTSAAGDEGGRQLKVATAEAILRALSAEDRFALVSLDVKATVLHPKSGLAAASDREIERALEALADHASGGATDLAAFFDESLGRVHGTEQPAIVYVGDGLATSGELSGEQIIDRLRRALSMSRARLFTVGVGTDADFGLLGELARVGGGESFRVDEGDQTTARALELAAAIKSPTLTDFELDLGAGLDEVLSNANGKLSRGTEVTVLARTHHDLPKSVKVRGRLEGKNFERSYSVKADNSVLNAFVPRLWAAEYVRRLLGTATGPDSDRGRIVKLGTDYGLMTPYTSILTLESEYAYQQRGIQRRGGRLRGVRLGALEPREERRIGVPAELWAAPRVAFGCSRSEAPSAAGEASPAAVAAPPQAASPQQAATATLETPPVTAPPATAVEESKSAADAPVPRPVAPDDLPEEPASAESAVAAPRKAGAAVRSKSPMMWNRDPSFSPGSSGSGLSGVTPRGGGSKPIHRAPASGGRNLDAGERGRDAGKTRAGEDERGMLGALKKKERAPQSSKPREPQAFLDLGVCSDAASRPLANRVLLWRKRLAAAKTAAELIERYDTARRACELNDWQAERLFLALMQQHLAQPAEAEALLARFADRPEVRKYIGKLILRRTVDKGLIAAVERALYGGTVNWLEADLKLQAIGDAALRLAALREIAAGAPNDPNAEIRIVRLLLELGKKDEALALGRRLRDAGTITPEIARELGDVLAEAGLGEEAVRIYSEIVEFDPNNAASRRLLGDIFLRHRWYDPAYRQYRTLTDSAPADPLGWLRLAAAAAGAGRVDEALRLERRVASAEGTPGPSDPRRWARLWSAVRLGGLLIAPQGAAGSATATEEREQRTRSIERELKELGLFSGPGRLTLLTWENLGADVVLVPRRSSEDVAVGESTDASPAALSASLLPQADVSHTAFVARLRSSLENRPTPLTVHTIDWDSKHFKVTRSERTIAPRTSEVSL